MTIGRRRESQLAIIALTVAAVTLSGVFQGARVAAAIGDESAVAPPALTLPSVELESIAGYENEAAFLQAIADQLAKIRTHGDDESATASVEAKLQATNLLLRKALEPPISRALLNMPAIDPPPNALRRPGDNAADDSMGWTVTGAELSLAAAEDLLRKLADDEDADEQWLSEHRQKAQTLQAFSGAFAAVLLHRAEKSASPDFRVAASKLSPLLEDPHPEVSAAARLYYAWLRGLAGERSQALAVLDPVTTAPQRDTLPYSFFARLLRCRIIAQQQGYPAAIALLLKIESRVDDWFREPAEREAARRAAQYLRAHVLADWHGELAGRGKTEAMNWCARQIETLAEEAFDTDRTVMRLGAAVPVIVKLPEPVPAQEPDGATPPAETNAPDVRPSDSG